MKTRNNSLDPRSKLVLIICISSLAALIQDVKYLTFIFFITCIIGYILESEILSITKKLRKMIGVFFVMIVIQSIFIKTGNPILNIGTVTLLTDVGIQKGLEFILRLAIILTSATILITSTPREIIQGLVEWKIPYEIAFMVSISIRFLPMLMDEIKDTFTAIQLRGIELNELSFKEKIEIYSYIFTPVVVNTIIKSQKLSISMETRGFRAYNKRTSYLKLQMTYKDYMLITLSILMTFATVYIYY